MLNYKFLKSFGSKISPSILSSCKQDSLLHHFNAVKMGNNHQSSKSLHKSCSLKLCRSDSYVSSRSESTSWKKSKDVTEKKFFQKNVNHQRNLLTPNREISTEEADKLREQNEDMKYKYQEYDTYKQDKYELEAARPRKNASQPVFNVFKSVAKEIDLNEHLQPSNLKPYGAQDHLYSPILMSNKNSCLVFTNPSYLPPGRQSVTKNNESKEVDDDN